MSINVNRNFHQLPEAKPDEKLCEKKPESTAQQEAP